MIQLKEDGTIAFVDTMNGWVTGLEAALQRFVVAFMMTPGTIVEAANYGGGGQQLYLSKRQDEHNTRERVENVLVETKRSLIPNEPDESEHRIIDVTLQSIDRQLSDRGYHIKIRVDFASASSHSIKIPSESYGTP